MDKIVRPPTYCSQEIHLTSKEMHRLRVLYEIGTPHNGVQ